MRKLAFVVLLTIGIVIVIRELKQTAEIEDAAERQRAYQAEYIHAVYANCIKDGGIPTRGYNEVICLRSREVMWRRKEYP